MDIFSSQTASLLASNLDKHPSISILLEFIPPANTYQMLTQSKTCHLKPTQKLSLLSIHILFTYPLIEPYSFTEAQQYHEWRTAMSNEYNALIQNDTWSWVPKLENVDLIGSKWVYKVKLRSNGSLQDYKACLVAQGYTQQLGVDYDKTYSPVVKLTTIRTMLSLTTTKG